MRFPAIAFSLSIAISAMDASAAPSQNHLGNDAGVIANAGQTAVSVPQKIGSSGTNPTYVAAQCEHGCGVSDDRQSFVGKIRSDPVAAFTVILAFFTAVLAVSTIALWWVTRAMADTSKKALLDLERPIVFGGISRAGLTLEGNDLLRSQLELSIYNHGRTMARLRRLEWELRVAEKGSIALPIDPFAVGGRALPPGTVCVSGDPFSESENLLTKWGLGTVEKIASGDASVWIVGFVRYDDVFQRHHISGFTLVFDPIGGRFVRRGGEVYNYERTECSKDIPPPSSNG